MSETLREAIERLAALYRSNANVSQFGKVYRNIAGDLDALLAEHPATPAEEAGEVVEGEREALADLRAAHRDSYPMGNIHHGSPERPDWGTFCVECKQSWPCDITQLLDHVAALTAKARAEAWDEGVDFCEEIAGVGYNPVGTHDANPYRADREQQ